MSKKISIEKREWLNNKKHIQKGKFVPIGYEVRFDRQAQVPYLVKDGKFAMSYDNALSIFLKGQYVLKNCLGGIFSWTSTYDQANILAKSMNESIYEPNTLEAELEQIYGPF